MTGRHVPATGTPADGSTILTIFIVLLLGIPSQLIFGPLGGAGTPSQILGMGGLAWWVLDRLRGERQWPRQPVRVALVLFVAAVLLSYVAATRRPIGDVELRSAQMGILSVLAWSGVTLLASDGISARERLDVLLGRLAVAGGLLACLGILQFATGRALVDHLAVPGLTANSHLVGVTGRAGFSRPAGTAIHAIEFSAVLTMILPFALHRGLYDVSRSAVRRWWPAGAIAVAVPISISRSAIVGAAVVLAVLLPTWPGPVRRRALGALTLLGGFLYLAVPGLLGTLTGLFTGIQGDDSALSRTGSYDLAWSFVVKSPLVGRGFLTFLPAYRILDNQYLGTLIDLGVLGLLALLGLFTTGAAVAARVRRRTSDTASRHLAQALAAGVSSGAVSFALFDAFSFPMAAALIFFLIGCSAALDRLAPGVEDAPAAEGVPQEDTTPGPRPRATGPQPTERSPRERHLQVDQQADQGRRS